MNILQLLAGLCLLLWGGPASAALDAQEDICSDPAVLMCDNFEDRAVGNGDLARSKFKQRGWSLSRFAADGPNVIADAAGVYAGSRALQMTYPAGQNTGGGFLDTIWSGGGRTAYVRWYTKFSANFKWSFVATKHMEITTGGGHAHHLVWFPSGGGTNKIPSNAFGFANFFPRQNVNNVLTMVPDQWYCQEMRITMNSVGGVTDGYLQGWIDGVQRWEYPNVNLDNTTPGNIQGMLLSGYWNCYSGSTNSEACTDPINDYHPLMQRWHDNLVVSTQRIGCLGNPVSGDTSAPNVPAGLSAQVASSSQINLTWTASTDNVGVTGYKIFRAGAQIATSAGTSYSNTGLTASTAYSYTVAAYDAAGNTSAQSSAASATTQAAPPPSSSITMGETAVLTTADSGNGNLLMAQSATLAQTATLQSLSFYVTAAAGQLRLGVYDATGPSGGPGQLKAETNTLTPVTGWNTANVIAPASLSAGAYWLAALPSSSALAFRKDVAAGASCRYYVYAFGALPAAYSTAPTVDPAHWSFYATLNTASTAPSCNVNGDGSTNVVDVQLAINQALGLAPCTSDVKQDGACNVLDVQRVANAALGGVCVMGP